MKHRVLHIAPENTAGVPYNVMEMQNVYGIEARLLTFYKIPFDFPEDICLNLPLPKGLLASKWRQLKLRNRIKIEKSDISKHLPYFKPKNALEKLYILRREKTNQREFLQAIAKEKLDEFDIIHFDSGICFFNDSRLAKKWKNEGKKIVNCYYGDDLRTRGIVKEMDELSDLNLTFEYDHTLRHPNINFLFFPFNMAELKYISDEDYDKSNVLRIVHSPTNRLVKGTPSLIKAFDKIKKNRNVELVLLEKLPRDKVIQMKSRCHIAIDQVGSRGGTGYGINSLETLSMGIPTITELNWGMEKWLPENPFVHSGENSLAERLMELIDNKELRLKKRIEGRKWVEKYHSYKSVFSELLRLYKQNHIL